MHQAIAKTFLLVIPRFYFYLEIWFYLSFPDTDRPPVSQGMLLEKVKEMCLVLSDDDGDKFPVCGSKFLKVIGIIEELDDLILDCLDRHRHRVLLRDCRAKAIFGYPVLRWLPNFDICICDPDDIGVFGLIKKKEEYDAKKKAKEERNKNFVERNEEKYD